MSADTKQLQADERAAEPQLADRELWERARAANSEPNESRIQAILDRIKAIETGGFPSSDLTRAKGVLEAMLTADVSLGIAERTAAVAARQAAVHAREAAVKSLSASLEQVEKTRKAQKSDLASIEGFVTQQEKKKSGGATPESSAPTELMAPVTATRPASAPVPAAGGWSPEVSIETPLAVAPAPAPAKAAAPAPKPAPAARPAAAPAPRHAVEAPSTMSTGTMRKLSRRRRIRTAPPPKKMEVEVATWGDNTFYTGFDNKIASGGLFVTSLETLPAGHELDLKIDLEGGKQISVRGRVEFARRDNPSNPDCTSGAGIKLLNLPNDAAAAIESFFKEREPLFISPAH